MSLQFPPRDSLLENDFAYALLELEKLSRECFDYARDYWNQQSRDSDAQEAYRKAQETIAAAIAQCVSRILIQLGKCDTGLVFIAPQYRDIRGYLRNIREGSEESLRHYYSYTCKYGQLAEGGNASEKQYFMPVAFWAYHIYERSLSIGGRSIKLSGFSDWMSKHGYLERDNTDPITCFHIHFDKDGNLTGDSGGREYENGVLNFWIPKGISPLKVTDEFCARLFTRENYWRWQNDTRSPLSDTAARVDFPVIEGTLSNDEALVAKAVFSTFFFSNFDRLEFINGKNVEWDKLLQSVEVHPASSPRGEAGAIMFALEARKLVTEYKRLFDQVPKAEKESGILTFPHFYALLLNPCLDFKRVSEKGIGSLGTVNLYSKSKIPSLLVAIIRKHVEAIYHFLRDLQEWEVGTEMGAESAFEAMSKAMGHDLSKVYATANGLIERCGCDAHQMRCRVAHTVAETALQHGMLWGSSTWARIPEEAQLWRETGMPTGVDGYVKCIAIQSWRLFLVSDVVRDIPEYTMTVEQQGEFLGLFDAVKKVASLAGSRGKQIYISSRMSNQDRRNLSAAIYRWMMAVLSNAWKHLFLQATGLTSLTGKTVEQRLVLVQQCLSTWEKSGIHLLNVQFENVKSKEIRMSVVNDCGQCSAHPPVRKSTFLVMLLAAQEILKCLSKRSVTLDNVEERSMFQPVDGHWVASLEAQGLQVVEGE